MIRRNVSFWKRAVVMIVATVGSMAMAATVSYAKLRLTVHEWPLAGDGLNNANSGLGLAEFRLSSGETVSALNGRATVESWPAKTGDEGREKLIDNSNSSKYYTSASENGKYVFVFTATGEAFSFDGYALTAADQNGRNPLTWTLEGCATDTDAWTLLDIQTLDADTVKAWGSGSQKTFTLPEDCTSTTVSASGSESFTLSGLLGATVGARTAATVTLPAGATLDLGEVTLFRLTVISDGAVTLSSSATPAIAWLDLTGVTGASTLTASVTGTLIAGPDTVLAADVAATRFFLPSNGRLSAATSAQWSPLQARNSEPDGICRLSGGEALTSVDIAKTISGGKRLELSKTVSSFCRDSEEGVLSLANGRRLILSEGADLTVATRLRTCDTSNNDSITQTGGTINCNGPAGSDVKTGPFVLGHWQNASTVYSLSGGILNVPNAQAKLGGDGGGTLTVSGTGIANLHSVSVRSGTLTVATGGTLNVGATGVSSSAAVSLSGGRLVLSGGTLGPWTLESLTLGVPFTLTASTDSTLRAATATGDSADITLTGTLSGTGALTVAGPGKVDLRANRPAKLTLADTATVELTLSTGDVVNGGVSFPTDMVAGDVTSRVSVALPDSTAASFTATVADGTLSIVLTKGSHAWTGGDAAWSAGFTDFTAGDDVTFGTGVTATATVDAPTVAGTVSVEGNATLAFHGAPLTVASVSVNTGATLTVQSAVYPFLRLSITAIQGNESLANRDAVALGEWTFLRNGQEVTPAGTWYDTLTGPESGNHALAHLLDHNFSNDNKWYRSGAPSASSPVRVTVGVKSENLFAFDAYAFYGTDRWGRLPSAWTLEASASGTDGTWTVIDRGTLVVETDPQTNTLAGTFALSAPLGVSVADTVTVNGTLTGAGAIHGNVTFAEGGKLVVPGDLSLTVSGTVSGTVPVELPTDAGDVVPVLRNAGAVTFALPEGYEAVASDGVWYAVRSVVRTLSAEVSGDSAWTALPWKGSDGNAVVSSADLFARGVVQSATLTLSADAALTLSGAVRTAALVLAGNGAATLSGGAPDLGAVTVGTGATLALSGKCLSALSGSGTAVFAPAGTLDLREGLALTGFTGTLRAASGTVRLNVNGTGLNGVAGVSVLNLAEGATLRLSITGVTGSKITLPSRLTGSGRLELANDSAEKRDVENGFTSSVSAADFTGALAVVGGSTKEKALRVKLSPMTLPTALNTMGVEILGDHTQIFGLPSSFMPSLRLDCTNTAQDSSWPDGGSYSFGCIRTAGDVTFAGDVTVVDGKSPRIGGNGNKTFERAVHGGTLLLGQTYGQAGVATTFFFKAGVTSSLRLRSNGGSALDAVLEAGCSGDIAFESSAAESSAVTFGTAVVSGRAGRSVTVSAGAVATLPAGKTWTAPGGFDVKGTLVFAGGTLTGPVAFADDAAVDLSAGAVTLTGTASASGVLTVTPPVGLATETVPLLTGAEGSALAAARPDSSVGLASGGLFATATALEYRPITLPGDIPAEDSLVCAALNAAAAQAGFSTVTAVTVTHADGTAGGSADAAALFSGVTSAVKDAEGSTGTVTVAYDFGIEYLTIKTLTVDVVAGNYAVLAAKVQGAASATAGYAADTVVEVWLDGVKCVTAVPMTTDPEGGIPAAGVRWFRIPYSTGAAGVFPGVGTYNFTVKAVSAPTTP